MSLPLVHARSQGPVVSALGRLALAATQQALAARLGRSAGSGERPVTPGPELRASLPARDPRLVADYLRWAGGDPSAWKGRLPPHLFPQWGFPLLFRTLEGIPYPLAKVLNGGCRIEVGSDLASDAPLELDACLESIDDDGRRAILHQRLHTRAGGGLGMTARLQAFVPLGSGEGKRRGPSARPLAPVGAREIARRRFPANAGLAFALLTGDFNPIHWLPPYARAAGFGRTILHGFGTLAVAWEALSRTLYAGDTRRLRTIDVRFTRPLKLPATVGVYVDGHGGVFVADAPGGPAYLTGSYTAASDAAEEMTDE